MGDLANMTDNDGRVNGFRLLRWLRSRAEMYREKEVMVKAQGCTSSWYVYSGRAAVLEEMAEDLSRELTPPDYPGDDDGDPERRCPNCLGAGEVQRTVPNRGLAHYTCQACNGTGKDCTVDDDTVDLDDPTLKGGAEGA